MKKEKKLKVTWQQNPLEEARTIGYMEGVSDGRLNLLKELIKYKLLKKGWKEIYNSMSDNNYKLK